MKYRTKLVEIEAMQFTEESKDQVLNFVRCNCHPEFDVKNNPILVIQTLEGDMTASIGDYVIKGLKGEFYPCKPDIFNMKYEAIVD